MAARPHSRFKPPAGRSLSSFLLFLACCLPAPATLAQVDEDDADVSYIYAAVMGTGTFKINGRRVSTLNLPFSYTRREMTADRPGLRWTLPTVLGYDAVSNHDWLGDLLDEDLVVLALMPGVEYQFAVTPVWAIKPFINLGVAQDFASGETIILGTVGTRALGTWRYDNGWELRWGNAFQLAAEYQTESHHRTSFGLLETGVDVRRDTGLFLKERKVNAGLYYRYQYFIPEWDIDRLRPRESDIGGLHEFGASVGLKRPLDVLGFSIARVRVGYNWGSGVEGWTFGTEFPF